MEIIDLMDYFDEVEVEEEYDGYFYKVSEIIKIIILGSLCGLKNVKQIHQWAVNGPHTMLLLDVMPPENCKTGITQRLFQALGE